MDQADRLRQLVMYKDNNKDRKLLKVITVCSGKGGVGKTNISANIAEAVRKKGFNVAILDADFGLANINIVFGINARYSIYDLLYSGKSIEDICVTSKSGIKIIPGGSGIRELSEISYDQQAKIIGEFSKLNDVDVMIIDTGAGISKNVTGFAQIADEVIVVTNPEPTAIADAYGMIKVLSQLKLCENINLLVNRALDQNEATNTYNRLQKTAKYFLNTNIKYAGYLLEDIRLKYCVRNKKIFIDAYPMSKNSRHIEEITDKILKINKKNKTESIKTFFLNFFKLSGRDK